MSTPGQCHFEGCIQPTDDECAYCDLHEPVESPLAPEPLVTHDLSVPCGDEIPTNDPCWRI